MMLLKLLTAGILLGILQVSAWAQATYQKSLRFPVKIEDLNKGSVHYTVKVLSPEKLSSLYPELLDMDTLGFTRKKDILIMVGKSAQVIKKPAGFFDNQTMINKKFLQHVMGEQKVTKSNENDYQINVPGGTSYRLRMFFDSDDISTLPNSRVIRAVTQVKKLDVITQGAYSTLVKEMDKFNSDAAGSVSISSFIPLKEEKTLMITYTLTGLKKPINKKKNVIKQSYLDETIATKDLIDRY